MEQFSSEFTVRFTTHYKLSKQSSENLCVKYVNATFTVSFVVVTVICILTSFSLLWHGVYRKSLNTSRALNRSRASNTSRALNRSRASNTSWALNRSRASNTSRVLKVGSTQLNVCVLSWGRTNTSQASITRWGSDLIVLIEDVQFKIQDSRFKDLR